MTLNAWRCTPRRRRRPWDSRAGKAGQLRRPMAAANPFAEQQAVTAIVKPEALPIGHLVFDLRDLDDGIAAMARKAAS